MALVVHCRLIVLLIIDTQQIVNIFVFEPCQYILASFANLLFTPFQQILQSLQNQLHLLIVKLVLVNFEHWQNYNVFVKAELLFHFLRYFCLLELRLVSNEKVQHHPHVLPWDVSNAGRERSHLFGLLERTGEERSDSGEWNVVDCIRSNF
jgi:hypothetical protein